MLSVRSLPICGRIVSATQQPELITQIQVCRRLGISDETWRRWRKAGRVPRPVALPGRPRWIVAEIDRYLAEGRFDQPNTRSFFRSAVRRRAS